MSKAIPTTAAGVQLGRYRVEAELGRGGMGVVYACMDEPLARRVAVKTLSVGLLGRDREARMTRFKREVKALTQLDHPGILHIYDAGEADDPVVGWVLYYAMELIEGETLSERLIRGGAMDRGAACAVVAKCAEALGSAHKRGIVHRDVKPANIFLAEGGRVVVADFGVCKIEGGQDITRKDQMVGTPSYLAPEQILGLPVDPRTDVFALGALLYVLITNTALRPQLDRAGLSRLAATDDAAKRAMAMKRVPEGLPQIIARALARDPKDRFEDGSALAEALESYCTRVPEPFEEAAPPDGPRPNLDGMTHSAFTQATAEGMPPAALREPAPPPEPPPPEVLGGDTAVDPLDPNAVEDPPDGESTERVARRMPVRGGADDEEDTTRAPPYGMSDDGLEDEGDTDASATQDGARNPWVDAFLAIPPKVRLAAGAFGGMFLLVLTAAVISVRTRTPPTAITVAPSAAPVAAAAEPSQRTIPEECMPTDGQGPNLREVAKLIEEATALDEKGAHAKALPLWEKAVAMDPADVKAELGAGRALRRAGQAERARTHLNCVIALRPGTPDAERAAQELEKLARR